MRSRRLILITPGDPAGIGPEIAAKIFRVRGRKSLRSRYPDMRFACVGARAPFEKLGTKILPFDENVLAQDFGDFGDHIPLLSAPSISPKKSILLEGYQSGWAIERATRLIQAGMASALVTGPISKERLQRGGFKYTGHTDFLADLCGVDEVTMMLANEQLRISLATVHIGLKDVPKALTREKLRRAVLHTVDSLKNWWGISKPRVAVAALNPHAGEDGLFGDEEIRVISPEIQSLQKDAKRRGYTLVGPLPADTLFANHVMARSQNRPENRFDAVVCMYHDQGLIPVKLLDFPRTVNVTLGLPIVRTSVDHGVAFDIAGKNVADPSSLESAIELAVDIVRNQPQVRKRK
ncbi:MAG: 4-hydroxythreonine-4-phosphate dehydrogenase PdxA [Bdellovibrionia bacterium]